MKIYTFKSDLAKEKALAGAIKSGYLSTQRSNASRQLYEQNPKRCKKCSTIFPYDARKKQFCNHSCSAAFNNCGVVRNGEERENKNCLYCYKPLSYSAKKFCTQRCQQDFQWKSWVDRLEVFGYVPEPITYARVKRFLKEKYGHVCIICKGTEWMGHKMPLILDHINGNSDDNSLTNLRLVCGNCDMQLPTYKSKNLGNGRAYRRKRYAEGKSY